MARRLRKDDFDDEEPANSGLVRLSVWGGVAAIALASAVLALQSRTGGDRLGALFGHPPPTSAVRPGGGVPTLNAELEMRRLADSVRLLTADRDRLLARLDALERNQDLTASLPRDSTSMTSSASHDAAGSAAAAAASASLAPGWSLVPGNFPPAAGVPASPVPAANAPTTPLPGAVAMAAPMQPQTARAGGLLGSEQAADSIATRTEFAVDIGGDSSFEGLRALWAAFKSSRADLLQGLRPVAAAREGPKPGTIELRLLVGPLNNASAAARLCASLVAAGVPCQPSVFDGQRLAVR